MTQSLLDSQEPVWEIGDNIDAADFFRALHELVQPDDVLVLEDGVHPPELKSWLQQHGEPRGERLPLGTTWPKTTVVGVAASETNLRFLASFADRLAKPEIAEHMSVQSGERACRICWLSPARSHPHALHQDRELPDAERTGRSEMGLSKPGRQHR